MNANVIVGAIFLIVVFLVWRKLKKMFPSIFSSSSGSSNSTRNWSCKGCGKIIQQGSRPSNGGKCGNGGHHVWEEL